MSDQIDEFDCADPWFLLEVAEHANPSDFLDEAYTGTHCYVAPDGWLVGFYYDDSELDCIEYFVTPRGHRIAVWGQEHNIELIERNQILQKWQSVGDYARLKEMAGLEYPKDELLPVAVLLFSHGVTAVIIGLFILFIADATETKKWETVVVMAVFVAACLYDFWRDLKKGRKP